MKSFSKPVAIISIVVLLIAGFFLYQKMSFTEKMATGYAKKFFNILMIKGSNKEFEEMYPSFGKGSRLVAPVLFRINSVTKRSDGDFEIYAVYEASKSLLYPINLVINRQGKVVSSNGVSYAYYDKTLEFAKKIGCLSGAENDAEIEKVISSKDLRSKLDQLADMEWYEIKQNKISFTGRISGSWGYFTGNAVVSNNTPIAFDSWDLKCYVEFLSSDGDVIDTDDVYFSSLTPYGSVSSMIYSSAGSASKVRYVVNLENSIAVKNKIKDYIINTTSEVCN